MVPSDLLLLPSNLFVFFDAEQFSRGLHFDAGITYLRLLSKLDQKLQFARSFKKCLCMYGQNLYWPKDTNSPLPECTIWSDSSTASWIDLGIVTSLSMQKQPELTWVSLYWESKYGFKSVRRCSSFWRMYHRTTLRTASLAVSTARKFLVKNCIRLFSKTFSLNSSMAAKDWTATVLITFTSEFDIHWKVRVLGLVGK